MLDRLHHIGAYIGNTPLRRLEFDAAELFVKLEFNNFSGSIKDRAVYHILSKGIEKGLITNGGSLIESSSGNFAIALASMCRLIGLQSTVVIDPNVNADYEKLLYCLATRVIKVAERDNTGGYLLNRIRRVEEVCREEEEVYWTNQYENPANYMAYYDTLGNELCSAFDQLDLAFIGVSTGGTIAGTSLRLKEKFPNIRIIAVDVEGSVIFGNPPKKRFLSGLGSSKVSPLVAKAEIDEVICLPEEEVILGCWGLLREQCILGGASAGAMYAAVNRYFAAHPQSKRPKAVFLCPDRGAAYMNTVYNREWVTATYPEARLRLPL